MGVRQTSSGVVQTTSGVVDTIPIPENALLHYPFRERTGGDTTLIEELAGHDGTADGLSNVSGSWWDGFAEDGDGTDDFGDVTAWDQTGIDFGTRLLSDWGLALTISGYTDSGGSACFLGQADVNTPGFQFHISDENVNSTNGNVELVMVDRTGSSNTQAIEGSSINDGGTYRIMVGGDGPAASDKVVFVNTTDSSSVVQNGGDQTDASNFTIPVYTHARNRASGSDLHVNCIVDNVIPLDSKPTAQVAQDDYDAQPWS